MADINVVPYIDVMLVLLIIFMITAPLLTQGVQVDLPDADAAPIDSEQLRNREPLVLSIDREGRFYVNIGRDAQTPVLVKADQSVPYGRVVQGMVLLQQAGARKIGFLTDPRAARALEELERRR